MAGTVVRAAGGLAWGDGAQVERRAQAGGAFPKDSQGTWGESARPAGRSGADWDRPGTVEQAWRKSELASCRRPPLATKQASFVRPSSSLGFGKHGPPMTDAGGWGLHLREGLAAALPAVYVSVHPVRMD